MARHLKNIVMSGLKNIISSYVPSPAVSTPPARGVRYFHPITDIDFLWGAMDKLQLGRKRRKHIIVRRYPHMGNRLLQLYTYHFPKTWSAACVANRELIKFAQRQAHALEHDTSRNGLEWRIRFLNHYFRVFKGGAAPEPGLKPYSRFYQYTYVAIYRQLKAALQNSSSPAQSDSSALTPDDVTFEPIDVCSLQAKQSCLTAKNTIRRPVLNPHFSLLPTRIDPPDITSFIPPNKNISPISCIYAKKAVPLCPILRNEL
jgi:hypothetical protein